MRKQKYLIILIAIIFIMLVAIRNIDDIELNEIYKVSYPVNVNNQMSDNGADYPEFAVLTDDKTKVLELKSDFVKIEFKDKEGWIPKWYLSEEAKTVNIVKPYLRILKEEMKTHYYPNDKALSYEHNILEGKVCKVIAEYEDWYNITFVNYAEPYFDNAWIKKVDTFSYDKEKVREGYLVKDVSIYKTNIEKNKFWIDPNSSTINGQIIINYTFEGFYYIYGRGGRAGYINIVDFKPIESTEYLQDNYLIY